MGRRESRLIDHHQCGEPDLTERGDLIADRRRQPDRDLTAETLQIGLSCRATALERHRERERTGHLQLGDTVRRRPALRLEDKRIPRRR